MFDFFTVLTSTWHEILLINYTIFILVINFTNQLHRNAVYLKILSQDATSKLGLKLLGLMVGYC